MPVAYKSLPNRHGDSINITHKKEKETLRKEKAVFKGSLDEGGEDRVMLEGFLQSVKTMLDVNLEDPVEQETVDVSNEIPHSFVAETKACIDNQIIKSG